MMKGDKWAVTLCVNGQQTIEERVAPIVSHLAQHYPMTAWLMSDLDATGCLGGGTTQCLNKNGALRVSSNDLLGILNEEGQVIELNATLTGEDELFRIIIRDGGSVDLLGSDELVPQTIMVYCGSFTVDFFMW